MRLYANLFICKVCPIAITTVSIPPYYFLSMLKERMLNKHLEHILIILISMNSIMGYFVRYTDITEFKPLSTTLLCRSRKKKERCTACSRYSNNSVVVCCVIIVVAWLDQGCDD